ncbi:hypothetical protein FSP39_004989 [Pinctada imbricata]|uniref:Cyclin-L1 n=1 Tax=Pinctada imbricata TaxID=66713 RepID=A0AA88YFS2_PINIB|nr:hypothetical protein FSP39_004989 [Pinctada imbricata]
MAAEEKPNPLTTRDFSKVQLTLENVLIPDEKLSPTPSMQDGLDLDSETDLRILGCELIQSAGILLKLPQVAMATGQVLFQRFYYSKSFVKHNMEVLAMACINLASKIEENPRRMRDVINVFHHIKQVRNQKTIHPLVLDSNYITLKNQVIKAERRVLKELGFCVHVQHPHKIIVMYLQVLESEHNQKLVQCAWNYMNDSFRTEVFMRFQPEIIASACIFLAARQLQVPLPNNPSWYSIFGVQEEDIREICLTILNLYARKRPNNDKLEAKVNEAKKIQLEAKNKAKGITSDHGTPNSTSRQNSPKNVSPNPALLHALKKMKTEDKGSENGSLKHYGSRKKRSMSPDHKSRSRSRSPRSSSRSSRSTSRSPKRRKNKLAHPYKRRGEKGYSPERLSSKDHRHSHKRKKHRSYSRSLSRSHSRSPERHKVSHKKRSKDDYKERDYREKDYREKERAYREKEYRDYNYSPDRHSSKRRRNGHPHSAEYTYDKYSKRK